MTVVTRFAPSPTGYLHVGGLRTALYAYLFARQNKGKFILRIEDTDQKRYVEGAVESLQSALKFFDLNWDEGPIFQSHRTEIYQKYAQQLLESGKAYRCFCTSEELDAMREQQAKLKIAPKYDRRCLELAPEKTAEKLAADQLREQEQEEKEKKKKSKRSKQKNANFANGADPGADSERASSMSMIKRAKVEKKKL